MAAEGKQPDEADIPTATAGPTGSDVVSSLIVVGPTNRGRSLGHKAVRMANKKMGSGLFMALMSGKYQGDHVLVTKRIEPGRYQIAPNSSAEGYVQVDLSNGVVPLDVPGTQPG